MVNIRYVGRYFYLESGCVDEVIIVLAYIHTNLLSSQAVKSREYSFFFVQQDAPNIIARSTVGDINADYT